MMSENCDRIYCHHLQIASRLWNYRMTVITAMTLQLIYLFIPRVQLYMPVLQLGRGRVSGWAGLMFVLTFPERG